MSKLIPQDIEDFLYDLGALQGGAPGAFEDYAKTAAALLWEKYVILEDPSIQVLPNPVNQPKPQKRKATTRQADFAAIRQKAMGRLFGLYLKSGREKCGRTIEEAAQMTELNAAEWEAFEAGTVPSPSALPPIAAAIGSTISQIAPMVLICQDAWMA